MNIYKIRTICISASKYFVKNYEYCTYINTQNELFNTNTGTIPVYFIIIVWRNMSSPCCLSPVFLHNNIIAKFQKAKLISTKVRTICISASKYFVKNYEYCTYNSTQNELFNTNRGTIPVYFIIIVWRNMSSPCCLSPVFLNNNIIAKFQKVKLISTK
jgi:hypothetical protein